MFRLSAAKATSKLRNCAVTLTLAALAAASHHHYDRILCRWARVHSTLPLAHTARPIADRSHDISGEVGPCPVGEDRRNQVLAVPRLRVPARPAPPPAAPALPPPLPWRRPHRPSPGLRGRTPPPPPRTSPSTSSAIPSRAPTGPRGR